MQLALSLDTCVPLAPQHDFPPAKDELAANIPAATTAKVVLIMHLRQHELPNVQWAYCRHPERKSGDPVELPDRFRSALLLTPAFRPVNSRPKVNTSRFNFNGLLSVRACTETMREAVETAFITMLLFPHRPQGRC